MRILISIGVLLVVFILVFIIYGIAFSEGIQFTLDRIRQVMGYEVYRNMVIEMQKSRKEALRNKEDKTIE